MARCAMHIVMFLARRTADIWDPSGSSLPITVILETQRFDVT